MIVEASVRYGDILKALDVRSIPGVDLEANDYVDALTADIDEPECELCHGEGPEEPEDTVDPNLIGDFLTAIRAGDMGTAQCLVGRVFINHDDVKLVERAVCGCAA